MNTTSTVFDATPFYAFSCRQCVDPIFLETSRSNCTGMPGTQTKWPAMYDFKMYEQSVLEHSNSRYYRIQSCTSGT